MIDLAAAAPLALPLVVALLAALAPAAIAAWTGRALLRRLEDPALPELLEARRQQLSLAALLAFGLVTWLGGVHAWWLLPIGLVALVMAGYPLRRALFGEPWGPGAYVVGQLRGIVAWLGFWILLAATPPLIVAGGGAHRLVALALGAALVAWRLGWTRIWLACLDGRPLTDPVLAERFAAVWARARVPAPPVHAFGFAGSRMMNAFAIVGTGAPAVAMSRTLLERLTPDESTAIFAHEVAHLEQWSGGRATRARVAAWLLVALALALPLAALELDPRTVPGMVDLWLAVVVLGVVLRGRGARRALESDADRRAVELTGDGEALVRALEILHRHARVPRRAAARTERVATHPSLAHRAQAIRETGASAPGDAPALAAPVLLRGAAAGSWVALDAARACWLDGVPDETPADLAALQASATRYRVVAYDDLVELRVDAGGARPMLRATDRAGARWAVPLDLASIGPAQDALDRVDGRLARQAAPAAPRDRVATLATLLVAVSALGAGDASVLWLAILAAVVRPGVVSLAALGALAVLRAALLVLGAPAGGVALAILVACAAGMIAGAVTALWRAGARARRVPDESMSLPERLLLVALAVVAAVRLAALLAAESVAPLDATLDNPALASATVALAAIGLAILMHPRVRRAQRVVAGALVAASLVGVVLSLGTERLAGRAPSLAWSEGRFETVATVPLPVATTSLVVSPGGTRWGATRGAAFFLGDDEAHPADAEGLADPDEAASGAGTVDTRTPAVVVGGFDGRPPRVLRGAVAAFIDERALLVLAVHRDSLVLRALASGEDTTPRWRLRLPALLMPVLRVDVARGTWYLAGTEREGWHYVVMSGALAGGPPLVRQRLVGGPPMTGGVLLADGGDALLAPRMVPLRGAATLPILSLAGGITYPFDLFREDRTGRHVVGRIPGIPDCRQAGVDSTIFCQTSGPRAALWRVGVAEPPRRVADLPMTFGPAALGAGRWVTALGVRDSLAVIDPATRSAVRAALDRGDGVVLAVASTPAGVVVLRRAAGREGRTAVSLLRIRDATTRG